MTRDENQQRTKRPKGGNVGGRRKKTPIEKKFFLRGVEERDEAYQTAVSYAPVDGAVWLSFPQWPYSCGQLAGGMQLDALQPCTVAISSFKH